MIMIMNGPSRSPPCAKKRHMQSDTRQSRPLSPVPAWGRQRVTIVRVHGFSIGRWVGGWEGGDRALTLAGSVRVIYEVDKRAGSESGNEGRRCWNNTQMISTSCIIA